jgi:hypothetical protein
MRWNVVGRSGVSLGRAMDCMPADRRKIENVTTTRPIEEAGDRQLDVLGGPVCI